VIAWPERVIGFLFVIEALILALLGVTSPHAGEAAWFAAIPALWRFPAFTLIPGWIVLRMIDLLFAGPARRSRNNIIVRFSP
jgi:hypothetical protein